MSKPKLYRGWYKITVPGRVDTWHYTYESSTDMLEHRRRRWALKNDLDNDIVKLTKGKPPQQVVESTYEAAKMAFDSAKLYLQGLKEELAKRKGDKPCPPSRPAKRASPTRKPSKRRRTAS